MKQVWILSKGERGNGGDVVGVYADRDLAKGQFVTEARAMHFTIDGAEQGADGELYLTAGCDFLELRPHQLIVRNEIEN